ncbi:MAG: hypothetical protein WA610_08575 [Thermodesulfovibrionales bacterium]
MKKRTDIIIYIVCLVLAVIISAVYYMERARAIRGLRSETEALSRQQPSRQEPVTAPERLGRMFPRQPELPLFIDGLYQYALKSDIINLDVQTLHPREKGARTGGSKEEKASILRSYPLRITMEGTYRNIAEYIRLMQNSERFTRVLELEIQPGNDLHKATMTLEIFSAAGPDAP